jgi:antitoxin MazE
MYKFRCISWRLRLKVAKWGNSLAIRIPKELAEELALKEGDGVTLTKARGGVALAKDDAQEGVRRYARNEFARTTPSRPSLAARRRCPESASALRSWEPAAGNPTRKSWRGNVEARSGFGLGQLLCVPERSQILGPAGRSLHGRLRLNSFFCECYCFYN